MRVKKHWPLLASGMLLLIVAFTQQATVPLYDGVGMPDEPYRYVAAPKGWETDRQPGDSVASGVAADGTNKDGIYLSTAEQGPQLYASFTQRTFTASLQASLITLHARPAGPDGSVPPEGKIVGNMYRVTADADNGEVVFATNPVAPSYIDLRLPQGYPAGATMVFRATPTQEWQSLPTDKIGADIYEAKAIGLGDYALTSTALQAKAAASVSKPSNWQRLGIVLIVVTAVGAGSATYIILAQKRRRARA